MSDADADAGNGNEQTNAVNIQSQFDSLREMLQNLSVNQLTSLEFQDEMRTKFEELSGDVTAIKNEQRFASDEIEGIRQEQERLSASGGEKEKPTTPRKGGLVFPTGTPMLPKGHTRRTSLFSRQVKEDTKSGDEENDKKESRTGGSRARRDFFRIRETNSRLENHKNIALSIPIEKVSLKLQNSPLEPF